MRRKKIMETQSKKQWQYITSGEKLEELKRENTILFDRVAVLNDKVFKDEANKDTLKKEIELAIEGYNKEKEIIIERLGYLPTENSTIDTRMSLRSRLQEIDAQINKLLISKN